MCSTKFQPLKFTDLPLARESIRDWSKIIISCIPVSFEFVAERTGFEIQKLSEYLKGEYDLEPFQEIQLGITLGLLVDYRVMKCYSPDGPYIVAVEDDFESFKNMLILSIVMGQGYGYSYELVTNSRTINKTYKHVVQVSDGDISIYRFSSKYSSTDIKRFWPNCRKQHRVKSAEFKEIMALIDEEIDSRLACTWDSNISYINDDYSNTLILY